MGIFNDDVKKQLLKLGFQYSSKIGFNKYSFENIELIKNAFSPNYNIHVHLKNGYIVSMWLDEGITVVEAALFAMKEFNDPLKFPPEIRDKMLLETSEFELIKEIGTSVQRLRRKKS